MVISNELKELIIPNLKMSIRKEDYDKIESMFGEVYLIEEEMEKVVCLRCKDSDGGEELCMMFLALNGSFYDICEWNYVKKKGVLL